MRIKDTYIVKWEDKPTDYHKKYGGVIEPPFLTKVYELDDGTYVLEGKIYGLQVITREEFQDYYGNFALQRQNNEKGL